jgi:hypothetical protein
LDAKGLRDDVRCPFHFFMAGATLNVTGQYEFTSLRIGVADRSWAYRCLISRIERISGVGAFAPASRFVVPGRQGFYSKFSCTETTLAGSLRVDAAVCGMQMCPAALVCATGINGDSIGLLFWVEFWDGAPKETAPYSYFVR